MEESRKRWIQTRKIVKVAVLPSFLIGTSSLLSAKSPLESLIMLSRPPNLSTISFPLLSPHKQSGMYSKAMTFALLLSRNIPSSKRHIEKIVLNLLSIMKTGLWRIRKEYFGQMKQRSTGLGLMEGCILGKKRENHFLTELLHQLLSMEGEITSWYGGVWGGME